MPIRVEIYGVGGVAIGVVTHAGPFRDVLESGLPVTIERATWHALDGSKPQPAGSLSVEEDDILVAIADDPDAIPVHAQWHDVTVDVGPYRVTGQLPTMPGFDPGRALARPTGEFVLLRDVRISLTTDVDGASVEQPAAFVNRYVVDRVAADLMLGFFFPGAEMIVTGGHEQFAAGATGSGAAIPAAAVTDLSEPAAPPA